jgi:hypothetical protein
MTPEFRKALWISLLCPWLLAGNCAPPPEDCGDGVDNDRDGEIDCDDAECRNDYYDEYYYECEVQESECDGTEDGDIDCDDSACDDDPACDSEGGEGGLGGGDASDGSDSSGGSDASGGSDSSGGSPATGGTPADGGSDGSTGGSDDGGAGADGSGGDSPVGPCAEPIEAEEGASFVELGNLNEFTDFTESSCQADGGGPDIATYYVAPTDGTLTIQTYSTYANLDISVRSDCDDPSSELPLACAAATGTQMQETIELMVDAQQTIFIIVSGATAAETEVAYLQLTLD